MKFETLCLHADDNRKDEWGTLTAPICQTAIFVHKGVGVPSDYSYYRLSNPTRAHLENTVARLENGTSAFAFSSGMSAIATVMKLFPAPALRAESCAGKNKKRRERLTNGEKTVNILL